MSVKCLVRILGRNLSTIEDGKPVLLGFATTRYIEAASTEEAASQGARAVAAECASLTRAGDPPPQISVHRVDVLSANYDGLRPTAGFTFFEEPSH